MPRSTPGDPDGAGGEGPGKSLAHKLDHLFRTIHPAGRGEYSLDEVAEGIRRRGVSTISSTYIWELRKGLKDNPTKRHLEALADFFGVSPLYFFDDDAARQIEAELGLLVSLREARVRYIATRAVGLSPQSLEAITSMIDHVRQLEGLADAPAPSRGPARRRRAAASQKAAGPSLEAPEAGQGDAPVAGPSPDAHAEEVERP